MYTALFPRQALTRMSAFRRHGACLTGPIPRRLQPERARSGDLPSEGAHRRSLAALSSLPDRCSKAVDSRLAVGLSPDPFPPRSWIDSDRPVQRHLIPVRNDLEGHQHVIA